MTSRPTLEKTVEQQCRELAQREGHALLKIQGQRGWPDRLLLTKYGQTFFIEFKQEGAKPRPLQAHIISILRAMGHDVSWITSVEQFKTILSFLDLKRRNGDLTSTKFEGLNGF